MLKKLFFLSVVSVSLCAEITLKEIDSKPPSRAKNFLIWQYLKQDINSYQADKAYKQVLGNNYKINSIYLKKSDNKALKHKIECRKKTKLLEINDSECLRLAFTPYKALQMSSQERIKMMKKVKSPSTKTLLKIQNEPHTQSAYEKYDADAILHFFNTCGYRYRREHLNLEFSTKFMNKLAKSSKIQRFIKIVLDDKKLDKLQKAIFKIDGNSLSSDNNFFLALNCLNNNKEDIALSYFQIAYKLAKYDSIKDKNLFWIYQITKDTKYLKKILESQDINIYSLYAHELLHKKPTNYFTSTKVKNQLNDKNLQDPFEWNEISKEIKNTPKDKLFELSESYEQKNMQPVQAIILEKAYNFKKHAFIMPYENYLKDLDTDDKALVYAIMRQESRYIPSALSRSFALGLMQLMPFLVDAIAKESKEKVQYKDMFSPQKNLEYSLKHIAWMKKRIDHPLFLAYGYNGGTGFLRRHLAKGAFKKGKYEPFLSMEMMDNTQTREYGKKVLSNYVMYKKILGEKVSIVNIFENIIHSDYLHYSQR